MVRFPFALPAIFSGMKIAMTMAVIGVIIGEFISAKAGSATTSFMPARGWKPA